jgi:outer membrane protein assembly factor BamB
MRRVPICFAHCLSFAIILAINSPAHAQRESTPQAAPPVLLDADPAAAKMLGAVRDYLTAKNWPDAVDLLRQIAEHHGEHLVAIEPGRFVNVQTCVDMFLSSLPPEGLALYRAKIDPQARRWFEMAQRLRDEEGLERVIRKAFLSSYGDDALLLLGELAWEQGALARARGYWEKLLPLAAPSEPGELPVVLKYPDSPLDRAQIEARLVLCSLIQGRQSRAEREYESFAQTYPQATGKFAGRSGNLATILNALVAIAKAAAPATVASADPATFAGNLDRNFVLPRSLDVGGELWSVRLKEMRVERTMRLDDFQVERFERGPAVLPFKVLSYYPAAWNRIAFCCDDTDVYAYDLSGARGGQPAWEGNDASIYHLPAEFTQNMPGARSRAGLPRFSVTITGNRLYARLGPMAAVSGRNRILNSTGNFLVCLDLARQGDLVWIIKADELEADGAHAEGGHWSFDGAPAAADGKVYVTLRRSDPQLQLNVACFDAATAKLLWNRKVCGGAEALAGEIDEIRHQLLTLAGERLFYCTNLGSIASLNARDGVINWIATYPRFEEETVVAFNKRQQYGPNPCLFHDGLVLAAPSDGDRLLAYDAETGILKWSRELSGRPQQLLGVAGSRLVAAGDFLWGIDIDTGRVAWCDGRSDPEAATSGRGLLAGDLVYWPRREEIRLVEISTGKAVRQIDMGQQHGLYGGGNLAIAGGLLLVAKSDRLVAFGEFGVRKKSAPNDLASRNQDRDRHRAISTRHTAWPLTATKDSGNHE